MYFCHMTLLLQIEMLRGTFFPIRSVPHCHILLVGQRKKSTRFSETIVSTCQVRRVVVLSDAGFRPLAWAAISFSALNLDRNNLSQANTDKFLPDLKMSTNGKRFLDFLKKKKQQRRLIFHSRLQLGKHCFSPRLLVR